MNYLALGDNPRRYGNAHPNIVPYQAFQTSDGYIILAVGNDSQFERFCELAGRPQLAADEKFRRNSDRVRNRERLLPLIVDIMLERGSDQWLEALNASGIPCGPINNIDQDFDDAQVRHRKMQIELEHPAAGKVAAVACPVKLSQTPPEYNRAPPLLGQDTDSVLTELLGLDPAALTDLRQTGVIA